MGQIIIQQQHFREWNESIPAPRVARHGLHREVPEGQENQTALSRTRQLQTRGRTHERRSQAAARVRHVRLHPWPHRQAPLPPPHGAGGRAQGSLRTAAASPEPGSAAADAAAGLQRPLLHDQQPPPGHTDQPQLRPPLLTIPRPPGETGSQHAHRAGEVPAALPRPRPAGPPQPRPRPPALGPSLPHLPPLRPAAPAAARPNSTATGHSLGKDRAAPGAALPPQDPRQRLPVQRDADGEQPPERVLHRDGAGSHGEGTHPEGVGAAAGGVATGGGEGVAGGGGDVRGAAVRGGAAGGAGLRHFQRRAAFHPFDGGDAGAAEEQEPLRELDGAEPHLHPRGGRRRDEPHFGGRVRHHPAHRTQVLVRLLLGGARVHVAQPVREQVAQEHAAQVRGGEARTGGGGAGRAGRGRAQPPRDEDTQEDQERQLHLPRQVLHPHQQAQPLRRGHPHGLHPLQESRGLPALRPTLPLPPLAAVPDVLHRAGAAVPAGLPHRAPGPEAQQHHDLLQHAGEADRLRRVLPPRGLPRTAPSRLHPPLQLSRTLHARPALHQQERRLLHRSHLLRDALLPPPLRHHQEHHPPRRSHAAVPQLLVLRPRGVRELRRPHRSPHPQRPHLQVSRAGPRPKALARLDCPGHPPMLRTSPLIYYNTILPTHRAIKTGQDQGIASVAVRACMRNDHAALKTRYLLVSYSKVKARASQLEPGTKAGVQWMLQVFWSAGQMIAIQLPPSIDSRFVLMALESSYWLSPNCLPPAITTESRASSMWPGTLGHSMGVILRCASLGGTAGCIEL